MTTSDPGDARILVSRRQLVLGAGAVGLLTAAYAALRQVGFYPQPEVPYVTLTPKSASIYQEIGDFLLPAGGPLPGSGGDTTTLSRIDELLTELPNHQARLLLALPLAFEHGTALDRFGARAMTHLPPERRQLYLASWAEATDILSAQLWAAVKTVYGMAYFERPDVQRAMGIAPFCRTVPPNPPVVPRDPWWTAASGPLTTRARVVVVGSGAGGAFTALTLAEAGLDVLVLEEGHPFHDQGIDVREATARFYAEGGFRTSSGSPPMPVAGGRALGGSTVVNSALCFQTPRATLDEWNERTNGAFADTEAFYRTQDAIEALIQVAETPDALLSGNDRAHRDAARALGWAEANIRRNTPRCAGCGQCNNGCPIGGKNSMDKVVLPRAAQSGARIVTGCVVERVGPGRVWGRVEGADGRPLGELSVDADVVVLASGAIASPRLLLDSGLAEANGPVGDGLQLHPVITGLGLLDRSVWTPGASQGHYIDAFAEERLIFESNPTVAGIFSSISAYGLPFTRLAAQAHRFGNAGVLLRDRSTGRVLPSSFGGARIQYALNDEDRRSLLRAYRLAGQLWFEGLGAELVVLGMFGVPIARSMDDVIRLTRDEVVADRFMTYSSHPQASCRVGTALDTDGQLRGVPGIYVTDASSLPTNVGRNPQISVMTVARILAERIAAKLGGTVLPLR